MSHPEAARTPVGKGCYRGQVATEFLIYTGVFILISVAAFVVVSDLQSSEVPLQQNKVAKETGDGFVTALSLAVKGGEGFSYNYSFPKTIYARGYAMDMRNLESGEPSINIGYDGEYGAFAYQYGLPKYKYRFSGPCLGPGVLESASCSNVLMMVNDGENLTLTQLP